MHQHLLLVLVEVIDVEVQLAILPLQAVALRGLQLLLDDLVFFLILLIVLFVILAFIIDRLLVLLQVLHSLLVELLLGYFWIWIKICSSEALLLCTLFSRTLFLAALLPAREVLVLLRLWLLFAFVLALFRIQVDVLLLDELLELVDLFTVHLNAHLVGGGDQVWVDLNLILALLSFLAFHLPLLPLCIPVGLVLLPVLRFCSRHLHFSLVSVGQDPCHFVCELLRLVVLHLQARVLPLVVILVCNLLPLHLEVGVHLVSVDFFSRGDCVLQVD